MTVHEGLWMRGKSLPSRKNLRMQGWSFTSPGWYFLTICTKDMRSVFGAVFNGRMVLNEAGRVAMDGEDGAACRVAIEEGRLLVLSPFDDALDAPSARRAAWCNQFVLAHADRAVVGHLNPDGMLPCILAEADPEKDVTFL